MSDRVYDDSLASVIVMPNMHDPNKWWVMRGKRIGVQQIFPCEICQRELVGMTEFIAELGAGKLETSALLVFCSQSCLEAHRERSNGDQGYGTRRHLAILDDAVVALVSQRPINSGDLH